MNLLLATMLAFQAQLPDLSIAPPQQQSETSLVNIQMTAFYALQADGAEEVDAGAEIPEALEDYAVLLEALPHDRFEFVSRDNTHAEVGQEVHLPISGIFTFYAIPLQIMDGGSVELALRVEMLQDSGYADALRAQGQAAPNYPLVMRGMPVNRGELVVVVEVLSEDEDGDGGAGGDDAQSEEQEEERDDQQDQEPGDPDASEEDDEGQDGEPDPSMQPETPQPPERSQDVPERDAELDLQNVEALLEYLEEVDRREQEEIRRKRDSIEIRGDWW